MKWDYQPWRFELGGNTAANGFLNKMICNRVTLDKLEEMRPSPGIVMGSDPTQIGAHFVHVGDTGPLKKQMNASNLHLVSD